MAAQHDTPGCATSGHAGPAGPASRPPSLARLASLPASALPELAPPDELEAPDELDPPDELAPPPPEVVPPPLAPPPPPELTLGPESPSAYSSSGVAAHAVPIHATKKQAATDLMSDESKHRPCHGCATASPRFPACGAPQERHTRTLRRDVPASADRFAARRAPAKPGSTHPRNGACTHGRNPRSSPCNSVPARSTNV